MRLKTTVLFLFAFLGTLASIPARDVQVREVQLTLYNKPVTGFRMVMDRSPDVIISKTTDHMALYNVQPFRFEQTLIYENILYSPVTETKEISLHYILKNQPNKLTELTVVAMYDYKRAISTREFPDLVERLMVDMSALVRKINGGTLRFMGKAFDQPVAPNGNQEFQRREEVKSNEIISHYEEEEVENNSVLLKKDPFTTENGEPASRDAVLKELESRIEKLEAWEARLNKREVALNKQVEALERDKKAHAEELVQHKLLVDSLVKLREAWQTESQYAAFAGDPRSFSLSDYIVAQENNYRNLIRDHVKTTYERDSLAVKVRESQVGQDQTESRNLEMKREVDRLRNENQELRNQWMMASAGGGQSAPRPTISQLLLDSLVQEIDERDVTIKRLQSEVTLAKTNQTRSTAGQENNDSLLAVISSLEAEKRDLESRVSQVERSLDQQKTKYGDLLARNTELSDELEDTKARLKEATTPKDREEANRQWQIETLRNTNKELEELLLAEREKNKQILVLRDSVKLLNARLKVQATNNPEISRLKSELKKKSEDLRARETQVRTLNDNNEQLTSRNKAQKKENEELKKQLQLANQQLKNSGQMNVGELQAKIDRYDEELKVLRKENAAQKNQLQENKLRMQSLDATVRQEIAEREAADSRLESKNATILSLRQENDSLRKDLGSAQRKMDNQSIEIADMQIRMDSLIEAGNLPLSTQEAFIRDQRKKLEQLEAQLDAREEKMVQDEKRAAQREAFVKQQEADLKKQEERLEGLKKREEELNIIEQRLRQNATADEILRELGAEKKPSGQSGPRFDEALQVKVTANKVAEFGRYVPVFQAEVGLGIKSVQKRVGGYLLYLGHFYDEKFPDFLYENILLAEISPDKFDLKVRMAPSGSGTVIQASFKKADGKYLDPEANDETTKRTRQFIQRMLRFNL